MNKEVTIDIENPKDNDLISRQAVLDTLSELNAESFYEAQEDSKEAYYEIRQSIKNMSPVNPQEPKWIPVSERFPEDAINAYLVCSKDGYMATIMYAGHGKWLIDDTDIVAWMPLPKPYKGSDRE